MCEMCIDNFLVKCDPSHVERHSDSSDFENAHEIPVVAPKQGNHSLFNSKSRKTKQEKDVINRRICNSFRLHSVNSKCGRNTTELKTNQNEQLLSSDKYINCKSNYRDKENVRVSVHKNNGDQIFHFKEKSSTRSPVRNKIVPCLSTMLKRPNNYKTSCIRQNQTDIFTSNYYNKAQYANCDRKHIKKCNRQHGGFSIQPVYAVNENITGFPFQRNDDRVTLTQLETINKNISDQSYDCSLSSGSELEDIKPHRHKKLMKQIMDKLEKRIKREYANSGKIRNEQQQYPSKLQLKSPCQIFTSSSCQAKCASTDSDGLSKMPSNSSAFWDFLLQKMKYQIQKAEVSKQKGFDCAQSCDPCTPESCEFFKTAQTMTKATQKKSDQSHSQESKLSGDQRERTFKSDGCCTDRQNTDLSSSETSNVSNKKKNSKTEVICKCYSDKKHKAQPKDSPLSGKPSPTEDGRPCQEKHDVITKAISEKYKGEILCIHNPPCVLINGCLNLPPPKTSSVTQGNFWPVTQPKKSSFAQMCRKMKRSKQKSLDQSIQYHPPYTDVQEYLPECRTEKIVQSVCNHNPPCEVVHGCHKAKFNPTLQNSCVHVPMCPKYPECLLEKRNMDNKTCIHTPRCPELPLCSRKYIILTAKENVSTQVKPKIKIGCRHQPPCLMIPKCLAQAICGDCIPGNAIPGCIHEPSCEMIPACCRKQVKDLASVPSQYPNASCRIV